MGQREYINIISMLSYLIAVLQMKFRLGEGGGVRARKPQEVGASFVSGCPAFLNYLRGSCSGSCFIC